jgi:RNA polymerase primary sigma factor
MIQPSKSADPVAHAAPGETGEATLSLKDAVAQLAKESQGKGVVTYDQLNALVPEALNDPAQLDQILEQLESRGIELVEEAVSDEAEIGGELGTGGDAEETMASRFDASAGGTEEIEPEVGEKIDDPVRLYLSSMGDYKLLTRDEEISYARSIEIYRNGFRR